MKLVEIIQNDPEVPAGVFAGFLSEWRVPFHILRPDLGGPLPDNAAAVIVLGGVMGVHDEATHPFLRPVKDYMARMLASGTPLFGICLGGQLLADIAGGAVYSKCCGEKGLVEVSLTGMGCADPIFAGIPPCFHAFQWHNDCFAVPPGAIHLAASAACPGQAFRLGNAWGVQFHPEVDGEIVAAWSGRTAAGERLFAEFADGAVAHRQLAERLLGNFLGVAGFRRAGRD